MREDLGTGAHDVLVIGGGPAGSTAALRAARHGLDVVLFEGTRHPRFHVGESLLPRNLDLIRSLGLEDCLHDVPRVRKVGASFVFGQDHETRDYHFRDGLLGGSPEALNVERAAFDAALLGAARRAGARVVEEATVRRILTLDSDGCAVEVVDASGRATVVRGRHLIDASGQGTVVGRHLGTRRTLPDLCKVAYYGHFRGVARPPGERGGYPEIVMCREGWFWVIPIDATRTSIGLVMDRDRARTIGVPPKERLAWAIARCPFVRRRTEGAEFPAANGVTADFSYRCEPFAGPGYFLVGDAATFVDPIFSTGVCLGMMGALAAVDAIRELRDGADPHRVRVRYQQTVDASSSVFFRLVRGYYRHSFRELFVNRTGPLQVHRAMISVLAGHVFPRPVFALRWRLALFDLFVRLQRYVPLVSRHEPFSLLDGEAPASAVRGGAVSPQAGRS